MPSPLQTLYRRIRYGKPVFVVSGLPRSGTSMAMKMLEAGGVPVVTDGIRRADDDNPEGYYELERVKELDKPDAPADPAWLRQARGHAVKIISSLLAHLPAANNYKVIFMRRDLSEVLASQAKMLARRGERSETEDERLRELYEEHLRKTKVLLRLRPQFDLLEVDYEDFIDDPRAQAERIAAFVARRMDVDKMAATVDVRLYRNRRRGRI